MQSIRPEDLPQVEPLGVVSPTHKILDRPELVSCPGEHIAELPIGLVIGFRRRGMLGHETIVPNDVINAGQGDHFLKDVRTAIVYRDSLRGLYTAMKLRSTADLRSALHADELEKAIPEYGFSGGWDVVKDAYRTPSPELPIDSEALALIVRAIDAGLLTRPSIPMTVKTGTTHGAPTFASSYEDHILHFAIANELKSVKPSSRKWADTIREMNTLGDVGFLGERTCALMLTRTGPLRKPTKYARFIDDRLYWVAEARGYSCRRRQVRGVPTWFNELQRQETMTLTSGLKNSPLLGHCFKFGDAAANNIAVFDALDRAEAAFGSHAAMFSDDASNFDDNTSAAVMRQAYEALPYSPEVRDRFLWAIDMPVLTGPLKAGHHAFLAYRDHGVLSGIIDTSFLDSVVNYCVAATAYRESLGWTKPKFYEALEKGQITIFSQGDDTLICGPRTDTEKYAKAGASLGYSRNVEDYPVFLKTWHRARGDYSNLASRALIRSLWRERRSPGPLHELLGIAVRWSFVERDPDYNVFWRALSAMHPGLLERGIKSLTELRVYLENHERELLSEREGPQGREKWAAFVTDLFTGRLSGRETDTDTDLSGLSPSSTNFTNFVLARLGGLEAYLAGRDSLDTFSHAARALDWRKELARQQGLRRRSREEKQAKELAVDYVQFD